LGCIKKWFILEKNWENRKNKIKINSEKADLSSQDPNKKASIMPHRTFEILLPEKIGQDAVKKSQNAS
jgi:hypothetical protein